MPSLADVAAQFLGTLVGILLWFVFGDTFQRALADFLADKGTDSWFDLVLLAYLVGLILYSLAPLDLTIHPADLWEKYHAGRITIVPFSQHSGSWPRFAYELVSDLLLFIPIGLFSATFPKRHNGEPRPLLASLCLGAAIVAGIEFGQFFVQSRYCDASDLITGMVGVGIGVFGHRWYAGRPSAGDDASFGRTASLLAIVLAYALCVLAILWAPYDFNTSDTESIRAYIDVLWHPTRARVRGRLLQRPWGHSAEAAAVRAVRILDRRVYIAAATGGPGRGQPGAAQRNGRIRAAYRTWSDLVAQPLCLIR